MLKVYNKNALTRQQRLVNAIVIGVAAGLVLFLAWLLLVKFIGVYIPLLYVLFGYLIGVAIQHFGKGVQIQFSILAVVITVVVILCCDLAAFGSIKHLLEQFSGGGMASLFEIAYRAAGIYLAFINARVV